MAALTPPCQGPASTTEEPVAPTPGQPWLHDLEIAVRGNVTMLGDRSGDARGPGTGLVVDDRRVLSTWVLTCDGEAPVTVASGSAGERTEVVAVPRHLRGEGADPAVQVHRRRRLVDGGLEEHVVLENRTTRSIQATLALHAGGDGLDLAGIKSGRPSPGSLTARIGRSDADTEAPSATWADERHRTRLSAEHGVVEVLADGGARLVWEVAVEPGGRAEQRVTVVAELVAATDFDAAPVAESPWAGVVVRAQDARLDALVDRSLPDLAGLLLRDPLAPDDVFAAAGTPWFLTLFGRDSLWAARMMLPFGTDLAAGTLRTLARRQGTRVDVATAEEPGKILHEVRRTAFTEGASSLPPVYFGTVDATPLWVCLLHDAWRWGMPRADVETLLPHLDRAVAWLRSSVDDSDDGFARYVDATGHGLANQGWKDSGDSMRRRDGSVAPAPIALVETQAYTVAAARAAAHLRSRLLGTDESALTAWAGDLAERVRGAFWVEDDAGPYLAMALDADGAPVDGVGSNMGHVLGTGLLNERESALVAARLTGPDLLAPGGIRTLGRGNPAYNPIGYHTGSVWSHDTAICATGLAAEGHHDAASAVARALLSAAGGFGYRLPELYGGEVGVAGPVPYPAACRPQAWAAAAGGALVSAALGLRPDAPAGRLEVRPVRPAPFGALRVEGLRVGAARIALEVDAAGELTGVEVEGDLEVVAATERPTRPGGAAHVGEGSRAAAR